jgi:hypothetical protein
LEKKRKEKKRRKRKRRKKSDWFPSGQSEQKDFLSGLFEILR